MVYTKKFNKRCEESPSYDIDYKFDMDIISQEPSIVNDRVVSKPLIVNVDSRDTFKDVKVSDYYLENLIATGAVSQLSNAIISGNAFTDMDRIEEHLSQLDSIEIDDMDVNIEGTEE